MSAYQALRSKAEEVWRLTVQPSRPRIFVGMGTCGVAAGARKTLEAVKAELARRNLDAEVSVGGCIGMCYQEPIVDIIKPGGSRVSYGHITADKAARLIDEVLVKGGSLPA